MKTPNHRRKIAKVKPLNPKRRKKAKKAPELVSECDYCGKPFSDKPLGMTHARTVNSALLAHAITGLSVKEHEGKWMFYCDDDCMRKAL